MAVFQTLSFPSRSG